MTEEFVPRLLTFHGGAQSRSDEDVIHAFGVPYRVSRAGPWAWAVYRAALEAAWERGDGVGQLDLDAFDAAAGLDARENEQPGEPPSLD